MKSVVLRSKYRETAISAAKIFRQHHNSYMQLIFHHRKDTLDKQEYGDCGPDISHKRGIWIRTRLLSVRPKTRRLKHRRHMTFVLCSTSRAKRPPKVAIMGQASGTHWHLLGLRILRLRDLGGRLSEECNQFWCSGPLNHAAVHGSDFFSPTPVNRRPWQAKWHDHSLTILYFQSRIFNNR